MMHEIKNGAISPKVDINKSGKDFNQLQEYFGKPKTDELDKE